MITEVFPNCYLKRLGPSISTILLPFIKFERQPSKGVLRKSSSESIQHIYRRTPNRNKVATQFLKQLFCKRRCDFFFATPLKQYTEHNVINFGGYFIYGGRSSPMSDAAQITSIPWNGLKRIKMIQVGKIQSSLLDLKCCVSISKLI